jgi:arginyl-tRNA synthetase
MLLVKQQLLADLGQALSALVPGHAHNPQLESPKVAAHGDWAITAALQWAKPLGQAPRQVAERLRADLQARPAFAQWVDSMDIAGPGFINLRL